MRLIADHLAAALAPLDLAFRDADAFRILMWRLGWDVQGLPPEYAAAADKVAEAVAAAAALGDDPDLPAIIAAIEKVGTVYEALAVAPPGVDAGVFLPEIGRRLLEYLPVEYLRIRIPGLLLGLEAIGTVDYEDVPPAGTRPGFTRVRFDWESLPDRLADPASIPSQVYGWGKNDIDFPKLAEVLSELLIALGLQVSIDQPELAFGEGFQAAWSGPPADAINLAVTAVLFEVHIADDVGLRLLELPAEGAALPGLILQPLVPQALSQQIELRDGWSVELRAGTDLANKFGAFLRPGEAACRRPSRPQLAD